ncbi:MAG: M48 family metalloprotease [Reyranellaceae bacterium]
MVLKRIVSCIALLMMVLGAPATASAQRLVLVRDAEIENTIRILATPIFRAAGLDPAAIEVHLVQDSSINAFVASGQRIFLHTGLIMRTENAGQLIGVIAHETGHIKGAHLAKLQDAIRNATAEAIIEQILAGAAVVAGSQVGRNDSGYPRDPRVMGGGSSTAMRNFLSYTRSQEQQADLAGVGFLERAGISPKGMLEFMRILQMQERLYVGAGGSSYMRTHPLSSERINYLEEQIAHSRVLNAGESPQFRELHARMVAKTLGYFDPRRALAKYPASDHSIPARYGRAMALWRSGQTGASLTILDGLIRDYPRDPYIHELKGDILRDSQRVAESVASYQRAVTLLPSSTALRYQLAQAQVNAGQFAPAVRNLDHVVLAEVRNVGAWDLMARAQAGLGNQGMTDLATAELFLLKGDRQAAIYKATAAERALPRGSPGWQRALDIKTFIESGRPRR